MPKVIDSWIIWKLSLAIYVKCSEDSERSAKIAIFNYPTLIWRPLSSEPPRISALALYCQKLRSLGYIFVADSIWVALQIFEQFCPKPGDANPLVAEPETDFNANGYSRRSFKVIYFGIIEEPLMGYIVQYTKCRLGCECSEDIASEWSENRHFRSPHSHLTPPLQRTFANIRIGVGAQSTLGRHEIFARKLCKKN